MQPIQRFITNAEQRPGFIDEDQDMAPPTINWAEEVQQRRQAEQAKLAAAGAEITTNCGCAVVNHDPRDEDQDMVPPEIDWAAMARLR